MALIPPDVGLQLRAQTDAQLQPITPVRPIPVDLPELRTGQAFTARIQETLPDNLYKALVAGKLITLQLPEGAKAGDLLELVLVDRTPRLLIAQQVPQAATPEGTPQPYPFATISRAAQMIGQLLAPEGEAPAPTLLNRGEALLSRPPTSAQDLLPALKTAVSQSGLFYESHQSQWIAGKLPLSSLLQEPQGQMSHPELLAANRIAQAAMKLGTPEGVKGDTTPTFRPNPLPVITTPYIGPALREEAATTPGGVSPAPTFTHAAVAEDLRPLVQQQLEAAAGQRLTWQGEVWPGQNMNWQIEWERQNKENGGQDSGTDETRRWRTTLALTTPRLGRIDATLQLEGGGVRITIAAPDDAGAADLRDAIPELTTALGQAGVPLLTMQVKHGGE